MNHRLSNISFRPRHVGWVCNASATCAVRAQRDLRVRTLRLSPKGLFRDERGITTIGMAISIFLCIALIFTGAQLYRIGSASAEIQEVADASALAAENEVAEFVSAVNICDAAVLSLTLLSATLFGLGIVAACVPPLAALSEKLIESANRIMEKRDGFYEGAVKGLNSIQRMLPFLAAANAMGVASANDEGASDASYFALAALVPQKGIDFQLDADGALADLSGQVDEDIDRIREDSAKAEDAAKKANEAKERAFMADCGSAPTQCMYERAGSLSDIASEDNALYTNVDAWNFQVPLKRLRAYYSSRKNDPVPSSGSIESRADSAIRKRFYEYASEEFESAFIDDADGSFSYSLPELFKNTDGMKQTKLYTEVRYPITASDGQQTMHAWSGCPKASDAVRMGSISELDAGGFTLCSSCEFRVSSMGNVAAASTNVSNGFEHHYALFLQAVKDYAQARSELDPLTQSVKDEVTPLLDSIKEIFEDAVAKRLIPDPPGKFGSIAMVVNTAKPPADSGFESSFVNGGTTLGTTAAVSGATLLKDSGSDGSSVITRVIGNLVGDVPLVGGFSNIVADCWTGLLRAYAKGQSALTETVESGLNSFSTSTSSGLGTWASDFLRDVIEGIGLQPADIDPRLPVLVNTGYIAIDGSTFSTNFMKVKQGALYGSTPSTGLFSSIASIVSEDLKERTDSSWMNVSTFSDPETGESFTIEWFLPGSDSASDGLLDSVISSLQQEVSGLDPVRSWQ